MKRLTSIAAIQSKLKPDKLPEQFKQLLTRKMEAIQRLKLIVKQKMKRSGGGKKKKKVKGRKIVKAAVEEMERMQVDA